jgi:hypothetical protein
MKSHPMLLTRCRENLCRGTFTNEDLISLDRRIEEFITPFSLKSVSGQVIMPKDGGRAAPSRPFGRIGCTSKSVNPKAPRKIFRAIDKVFVTKHEIGVATSYKERKFRPSVRSTMRLPIDTGTVKFAAAGPADLVVPPC